MLALTVPVIITGKPVIKTRGIMRTIFILLALIPILGALVSQSVMQSEAALTLPDNIMIGVGETQQIEASITCPTLDCRIIFARIEYDPAVISVDRVLAGRFLGREVIAPRSSNYIDRRDGLISINFRNPVSSVLPEEETTAFIITITGREVGESPLSFVTGGIGDETQLTDGRVQVVSERQTPISTPLPDASPVGTAEVYTATISQNTNIYAGPAETFQVLSEVETDQSLRVVGSTEDRLWLYVVLPDNRRVGWIDASAVVDIANSANIPVVTLSPSSTPTPTTTALMSSATGVVEATPTILPASATGAIETTPTLPASTPTLPPASPAAFVPLPFALIEASRVNLRSGPSLTFPMVRQAVRGDGFVILSETETAGLMWYEVRLDDATTAWVREDVIDYRFVSPDASTFVTVTPTPQR
jgi:uncharacterized protein YgiM (DUF1202 family)